MLFRWHQALSKSPHPCDDDTWEVIRVLVLIIRYGNITVFPVTNLGPNEVRTARTFLCKLEGTVESSVTQTHKNSFQYFQKHQNYGKSPIVNKI